MTSTHWNAAYSARGAVCGIQEEAFILLEEIPASTKFEANTYKPLMGIMAKN